VLDSRSLPRRALGNPRFRRSGDVTRPPYRQLEIPASNGIGQVRAIAKMYGVFAAGGAALGIRRETLGELATPVVAPPEGWYDAVLQTDIGYALGFQKPIAGLRFGSGPGCYGTPGLGGSFGFADPDMQLGYAYAPNRCGWALWNNPRERNLRKTIYRCLANQIG
jgi:CubicO group peptidase (beta-lactamase class C family)